MHVFMLCTVYDKEHLSAKPVYSSPYDMSNNGKFKYDMICWFTNENKNLDRRELSWTFDQCDMIICDVKFVKRGNVKEWKPRCRTDGGV